MKTYLAMPVRALALIAAFALLAGCSKSTTTTDTTGDVTGSTPSTSSTPSTTPPATQSLMDQLGGMTGVNQLADAFAANLAADPMLSPVLNAEAINAAKQGLVNEIAKTSGAAEPYPGSNLLSALTGKVTTVDGANAVTNALSKAADSVNVSAATKGSLMAMMTPITQSLVG
jgi:truncated hemoglobin YjbI